MTDRRGRSLKTNSPSRREISRTINIDFSPRIPGARLMLGLTHRALCLVTVGYLLLRMLYACMSAPFRLAIKSQ
jgi:hypothetical protein